MYIFPENQLNHYQALRKVCEVVKQEICRPQSAGKLRMQYQSGQLIERSISYYSETLEYSGVLSLADSDTYKQQFIIPVLADSFKFY